MRRPRSLSYWHALGKVTCPTSRASGTRYWRTGWVSGNDQGEHAFVTAPAAIHKFVDPMVDDAFDLAKALVAALTYGIAKSDPGRGRIMLPSVLLNKLVAGHSIPRRPVPGLLGNSRTRVSSRALPA